MRGATSRWSNWPAFDAASDNATFQTLPRSPGKNRRAIDSVSVQISKVSGDGVTYREVRIRNHRFRSAERQLARPYLSVPEDGRGGFSSYFRTSCPKRIGRVKRWVSFQDRQRPKVISAKTEGRGSLSPSHQEQAQVKTLCQKSPLAEQSLWLQRKSSCHVFPRSSAFHAHFFARLGSKPSHRRRPSGPVAHVAAPAGPRPSREH